MCLQVYLRHLGFAFLFVWLVLGFFFICLFYFVAGTEVIEICCWQKKNQPICIKVHYLPIYKNTFKSFAIIFHSVFTDL